MDRCGECFWYNGGFCDWWITLADSGEAACEFFDPYGPDEDAEENNED